MANFIDEIKDNKLLLYSFIIIIVIVLVMEGFTIYYFSLKINSSSNTSSLKEEKSTDKKEINKVVIDIKGAVNSPGTYELTDEKRVSDAIEIADGLLDNAYTKNINLSKRLTDEMVIVINTTDEINNLLKLFLDSARMIKEKDSNVQFTLAQAPNIKDSLINPAINEYKDLDIKIIKNANYQLLSVSDALILASGTVALEAAIYETPMIISYKGPWILYLIYLLVRCIKRVSLPNIIMNKDIVPELVQAKAKPQIISSVILKILNDKDFRNNMITSLGDVKQNLKTSGAAQKVAKEISDNI